MRLKGRHGTSGATETISESRDEFASSSGVGECIESCSWCCIRTLLEVHVMCLKTSLIQVVLCGSQVRDTDTEVLPTAG